MAMLAEPRRKQKWTLNPRGKQWSEDSNKFGQKMLEKMGWTSGKGLGANEQGMTEHVRVALKNDTSGVGFKMDEMDKAWTEHQDGFNELLKQLQKNQEVDEVEITPEPEITHVSLSGKSLELKSKKSRARVHYQKFTRGKDVNKYSSKDLANIFGQKDLTVKTNEQKVEHEQKDLSPEPCGSENTWNGVTTINRGSISDYFKNKAASSYKPTENCKVNNATDSEDESRYVGFGFSGTEDKVNSGHNKLANGNYKYGFINPCLSIDESKEVLTPNTKQKSSKKHMDQSMFYTKASAEDQSKKFKRKSSVSHDNLSENGFANAALSLEDSHSDEVRDGTQYEVSRAEFGLTNSAFDPEDEQCNRRRVTFNDRVEYSTDLVKKKTINATLDKFEVENKKHKRKRKYEETAIPVSDGFVNEALEIEEKPVEEQDNEINERKCRKAKRRRETRPAVLETIEEIPEEDRRQEAENPEIIYANIADIAEGSKKKKKKKKNKTKENNVLEQDESTMTGNNINEIQAKALCYEDDKVISEEIMSLTDKGKTKIKRKKDKTDKDQEKVRNIDEQKKLDESLEQPIKRKKYKKSKETREDVDNEFRSPVHNEKEISDKENEQTEEESPKIEKKRRIKVKKSISTAAVIEAEANTEDQVQQERQPENSVTASAGTQQNMSRSPWNEKRRMSKKLLKILFHRNAVSDFPGSNIKDIQGYGSTAW